MNATNQSLLNLPIDFHLIFLCDARRTSVHSLFKNAYRCFILSNFFSAVKLERSLVRFTWTPSLDKLIRSKNINQQIEYSTNFMFFVLALPAHT